MTDTEIKFRVSQQGAERVSQDFQKLDGSLEDVKSAGQESTKEIRNFGNVGQQVGRTLASSAGLTGGIGRVVGSLIGSGGLGFALGAATVAVGMLVKEIANGGLEIKEYIKKIQDMKSESELAADATNELKDALEKLTTSQMISRINALSDSVNNVFKQALLTYGIGAKQFAESLLMLEQLTGEVGSRSIMTTHIPKTGSFAENIKAQVKEFTRLRDEVAQTKDEYDRYNSMIKMYNSLLKEQNETTKKITKATVEYARALDRVAGGPGSSVAGAANRVRNSFGFDATRRGTSGGASGAMISRELQEQMNQTMDMIKVTAGVLREEFTAAWESVFGEANSLFEKFAMRISEYFIELALKNAAFALMNLIFPGAGIIAGAAAGASGATPGRSFNIILDGDKVGSFVDRRVPYSINRATRLDII